MTVNDRAVVVPSAPDMNMMLDLRSMIDILLRYRWSIVGIVGVSTLASILIVFSITPQYRATAKLHIEPKGRQVIDIEEVYEPGFGTLEYLETQFEILRSRGLARRVMERLELFDHPEFNPPPEEDDSAVISDILAGISALFADENAVDTDELAVDETLPAVSRFSSKVSVDPVFKTQLVEVSFNSETPELAAKIANGLVEAYIQSGLDARLDATRSATDWINQRMPEVKQRLEESERELQEYREKNKLVNVGGSRGLVEEDLADSTRRLREARKARSEIANVIKQIQAAGDDMLRLQEIPRLLEDSLVQQTKRSYLEARDRVVELQSRYGPRHPEMVSAREREQDARAAFERQLKNAADGVRIDYKVANQNVKSLESVVAGGTERIQALDRKQYEAQVLEREVKSNRQIYEEFLKRFKETDVTADYEPVNARIIDRAVVPRRPYKPRKKLIVALTIFTSSFLALLLAITRHFLDDTVRSESELETVTGLGVLGAIPMSTLVREAGTKPAVIEDPKSAFAECLRTVRASLMLTGIDQPHKSIVVTSAAPQEGKTTFAVNLAMVLGETEKVLLIDCDMRKPAVRQFLAMPSDAKGLCDVVAGTVELADAIHRYETGNIDVLQLGSLPPNPIEIITSKKFESVLADVARDYDRVIVDSAPLLAVSDTLLLSKHMDGVIYLVKADSVSRRAIRGVLKQIFAAEIPVIGAVLNQVHHKQVGRYGAYQYYAGRYA